MELKKESAKTYIHLATVKGRAASVRRTQARPLEPAKPVPAHSYVDKQARDKVVSANRISNLGRYTTKKANVADESNQSSYLMELRHDDRDIKIESMCDATESPSHTSITAVSDRRGFDVAGSR